MFKKFIISLLISTLILQCSNQAGDKPTREQKNWCIKNSGVVQRTSELTSEEQELLNDLYEAQKLYQNTTEINVSFIQFQNKLLQNDEDTMKICKIWAEINKTTSN